MPELSGYGTEPDVSQPVEVAQERPEVPGHAVVGVVPQQFPTQRDALISYRVMPMVLSGSAEPLRIAAQLKQRVGGGLHQQLEDDAPVAQGK